MFWALHALLESHNLTPEAAARDFCHLQRKALFSANRFAESDTSIIYVWLGNGFAYLGMTKLMRLHRTSTSGGLLPVGRACHGRGPTRHCFRTTVADRRAKRISLQ
eukprot:802397-Alexandrium_andersonii.AAC.1